MVEIAVVLVEVDQQHRLAPHVRVGGERVQHFLHVPAALHGAGGAGVLGVGGGRDDPRHLRQRAVLHGLAEGAKEAAVGHGVGDALVERVAGIVAGGVVRGIHVAVAVHRLARRQVGLAVLPEADERVVGEVVGHVLVHHPRHAGLLQALGIGGPVVAARADVGVRIQLVPHVVHHRLAGRPHGAVRAGPVEEAVGIGTAVQRAEIRIAHGEGIGQRELERGLGLHVVAHGLGLLVARPFGHAAAVPGVARIDPAVGRAAHALGVAGSLVQVVGQHGLAVLVGLLPDVAPARQGNGEAVAEAAHAGQRAEVVVERAVFLHDDDDVLHVHDRAGALVGGNGQGAPDAGREQAQRGGAGRGAGGGLQELAFGRIEGHGGRGKEEDGTDGKCGPLRVRSA